MGDGAGARDLGVNEAERPWNTALAEEPLAFADDYREDSRRCSSMRPASRSVWAGRSSRGPEALAPAGT